MPALIFDLDGTLVDTVYAHVFAWQRALAEEGMPIDGWRIHRRIGMSGGLFTRAVAREVGRELSPEETEALQRRHGRIFARAAARPAAAARRGRAARRPAGARGRARHRHLGPPPRDRRVARGARGASRDGRDRSRRSSRGRSRPRISSSPAPRRSGVEPADCYVVGDAVWDLLAARRAAMLSIGLLSGGYGTDELLQAGAFRVYADAADLHASLDELGFD